MSRKAGLRLIGVAIGATLVVTVTAVVVWLSRDDGAAAAPVKPAPAAWQRPTVTNAELAQRLGVKITQVAVSGHGGLVDLRYRVLDPDRANEVHDAAKPPAVVDDRSGVVVNQLYMDHSHSGPFRAGATYYLIFNNPGNLVRRGATVSVLLGDTQVDHVQVR
jgi:hypothetical protein